MGSCCSSLNYYVIANQELFRYFSNFFVNSCNVMSDHCELNFVVEFGMPCYNTHESELTKDESCSHKCKGKYVWENNRSNMILDNLQSESVHDQLNSIAENLKQAISNADVDISISFYHFS